MGTHAKLKIYVLNLPFQLKKNVLSGSGKSKGSCPVVGEIKKGFSAL